MPRSQSRQASPALSASLLATQPTLDVNGAEDSALYPPVEAATGSSSAKRKEGYVLYPMRWLALFQLAVLNCGNAAQWVVFGIVVDQAKEDFGLTTVNVNMLSASYEMVFAVAGPLAMILYDRLGLRSGLRWASVFNLLGCIMRFVSTLWAPNFGVMMVSQCLLAVTIVFTFAAPPILAARWFGDHERTMATTIGAVSNTMGLALGQLIPPLIVTPENHTRDRWLILFAVQGSYVLFEAILVAFVIPFGPATPPSSAEEVKGPGRAEAVAEEDHDTTPFLLADDDSSSSSSSGAAPTASVAVQNASRNSSRRESLVRRHSVASEVMEAHGGGMQKELGVLFSSHPFCGLFVGMALFFGCQWSAIGLMAQIVKPMGISEATVGWMGFFQILAGAIVAIPFSAWVDRIRAYKAPLTAMLIACTTLYTVYAMILTFQPPGMVPLAFAAYVLLGIPQGCAIPVMFEYAVELTYPVDESLSGMAIVWLANVVSVPMIFLFPAIVGSPPHRNAALVVLYLMGAVSFVATLLVALPEEHLKRLAYERACEDIANGGRPAHDDADGADR